jgi:hypothetical protein
MTSPHLWCGLLPFNKEGINMKNRIKKLVGASLLCCVSAMGPSNAHAAFGVVSLIGGTGGAVLIGAGAVLTIAGSAGVLGTCYVGGNSAGWSKSCRNFRNFAFWPGLALLSADGSSASSTIAEQISSKYHADSESANRIADRIYNKAIAASKAAAQGQLPANSSERLVVHANVSLSAEELMELSEPEFIGSEGFAQLVQDYR